MPKNSQAEDVHQGIPFVRLIKVDLAPNRGDPYAIPIIEIPETTSAKSRRLFLAAGVVP